MNIHHIGVVVKDIKKSSNLYQHLGYTQVSPVIEDEVQHNRLLFLKNGDLLIELIEPIDSSSPVYNSRNLGYHHICYQVEDLDKTISLFEGTKLGKIFTDKITAPAFCGKKVMFAMLKDGSIIEFLEGGTNV